jgi:hypothetical protein
MNWIWYEYKVDGRWEVLIISYSMTPVRTPPKILRLAHPLLEWWYGMVWWCGNMTASHGWWLLNTFYMYEGGSGMSMKWITACPQWEPHSKSYDWPTPFWSDGMVWWCGNMAASHGWRLLNTLYEVDLVWVYPSLNFVMVVWFVPSY